MLSPRLSKFYMKIASSDDESTQQMTRVQNRGGGGGDSGVSLKMRLLFETTNRLKCFKVRAL